MTNNQDDGATFVDEVAALKMRVLPLRMSRLLLTMKMLLLRTMVGYFRG